MSDDEEVMRSEEEGDEGPSEAQLAMQKRRQQQTVSTSGLDDEAQEMLEQNRQDRDKMEEEINELRERSERRRREREQEEREMAERREAEEHRRKADEEERKKKKNEEEEKKKEERAAKMAEFDKWKNPQTPNFVISRKDRPAGPGGATDEEGGEGGEKKSREQLEAEKQAILKQRIQPCDTAGMDTGKLSEKARELHALMFRLESERYDLERRFKAQMNDMQDLAERARGMNKVGKAGSIKRVQLGDEESDTIQEKFAGCPGKIVMYSQFERQKDKREYVSRRDIYTGPVYGHPADRIAPTKTIEWSEEGLPLYKDFGGEGGEGGEATEAAES